MHDESTEARIAKAMGLIEDYGGIDDGHHRQWVLDQVVRALLGGDAEACRVWRAGVEAGEAFDSDA